jgi:hypothetical protein
LPTESGTVTRTCGLLSIAPLGGAIEFALDRVSGVRLILSSSSALAGKGKSAKAMNRSLKSHFRRRIWQGAINLTSTTARPADHMLI